MPWFRWTWHILGAALVGALALAFYVDAEPDRTRYYRLTTELETEGQPFQLDVVVRCGDIEVMRSGGGGRLAYRQLPYVYGRPTPAGHAVLMRVPDFCLMLDVGTPLAKADIEEMKAGKVGLPLLFWMPDKADIDRMTAYTSLKGYDSPGSTLRYVRTRFAEATEADWKAWMAREGRPFVTRANDPFIQWDEKGAKIPQGRLSLYCAGLRLLPIPPSLKDEVAAAQPPEKPFFWPGGDAALAMMRKAADLLPPEQSRRFRGRPYPGGVYQFGYDLIPYDARTVRTSTEPLATNFRPNSLVTVHRVDLDEPVRGRAECRRGSGAYPNLWIVKRGDRAAVVDQHGPLYIDTDYVFKSKSRYRTADYRRLERGRFQVMSVPSVYGQRPLRVLRYDIMIRITGWLGTPQCLASAAALLSDFGP